MSFELKLFDPLNQIIVSPAPCVGGGGGGVDGGGGGGGGRERHIDNIAPGLCPLPTPGTT